MFLLRCPSDQRGGVEKVGDSQDRQTADPGSDVAAVLHLADRKSLTFGQVELDVSLRQRLQVKARFISKLTLNKLL